MSLAGQTVFITGASKGIGAAIATTFASAGASLILAARNTADLSTLQSTLSALPCSPQVHTVPIDVRSASDLQAAMRAGLLLLDAPAYDILVNNAGLALAAPAPFWRQSLADIDTMLDTNVRGMLYAAHAVLNEGGMAAAGKGTILNVTSTTALEVPPFPGEAVYHATKAAQEAFSNALRVELVGTNVRVLALRPGVVSGHFHEQRIGFDQQEYEGFMSGFEALVADDVADAALFMVTRREGASVKALDVVPSAQRSLAVFDREWNERNGRKEGA